MMIMAGGLVHRQGHNHNVQKFGATPNFFKIFEDNGKWVELFIEKCVNTHGYTVYKAKTSSGIVLQAT